MTTTEANQLIETWKKETYRVHGGIRGTALLTGAMLAMMPLLLCDEYAHGMTRELCEKKITERINKLKKHESLHR